LTHTARASAPRASAPRQLNAFSVDVEDYFQVEAFSKYVSREEWPTFPARVRTNTQRLLDLLERYGVRGTFFVLGWVADREPALVREIRDRGHELGCHSYWHRLIYRLSPQEFEEDTRRAKHAVETAAGAEIAAYRAPTFSITANSLWALDVLARCGFRFDSSIFPIYHDNYGIVGSPRDPYAVNVDDGRAQIVEFPISTVRVLGRDLPVAGGGYLRMLPLWYNRAGMDAMGAQTRPAMVYVHPWEVDPDQPRIRAGLKSRLRHYTNLGRMQARLEYLLERYAFGPVGEVLAGRSLPQYSIDRARKTLAPAGNGS
jgi:polysaccharide deacetylase family protein (PEP-CTERM system associated)